MAGKSNLPALDDLELRRKQSERFSEGIGNLGDYAKELKKTQKWGLYVSLISGLFLILFMGFALIMAFWKGGIGGIIDLSSSNRYFNCTSEMGNDTVRNYYDAKNFQDMYNGTCLVYHKTRGVTDG